MKRKPKPKAKPVSKPKPKPEAKTVTRSRGKPIQVYLGEDELKMLLRIKRRRARSRSAIESTSDLFRYWIRRADQLHKNRDDRARAATAQPADPRQLQLPAASLDKPAANGVHA